MGSDGEVGEGFGGYIRGPTKCSLDGLLGRL